MGSPWAAVSPAAPVLPACPGLGSARAVPAQDPLGRSNCPHRAHRAQGCVPRVAQEELAVLNSPWVKGAKEGTSADANQGQAVGPCPPHCCDQMLDKLLTPDAGFNLCLTSQGTTVPPPTFVPAKAGQRVCHKLHVWQQLGIPWDRALFI